MAGLSVPRAWLERVTRHPRTVVAATLLLTLSAGAGLIRLRVETSGRTLVPADHPAVESDRRIAEIFGADDRLVVAVIAPGGAGSVLRAPSLELVSRLTERLEGLEGVPRGGVSSLATMDVAQREGDTLRLRPLVGRDEVADPRRLAVALERDRFFDGLWISADRSAAAILVRLHPEADRRQLVRQTRRILDQEGRGRPETLHLAGAPVAEELLGEHVLGDLARMLPLVIGVLALLLFGVFRSVFQVLVPLVEAGCCIVIALGALAWLGRPLTLVTAISPVILVGLAVADEIHIFERYAALRSSRRPGDDPRAPVVQAVLELWRPVVFTSLTTAVGFLAFLTSTLAAVRDFGLFTAVGIMAALALSLTFVPACLALAADAGTGSLGTRGRLAGRLGRWAGELSDVCRRRRVAVLGLCVLFVLGSPLSVGRIRVQDSWVGNFAPQSPLARADRAINDSFHGTHRLRVMLDSGRREGVYDPVLLREVEELQRRIGALDEVGGTLSVVDVLRRAGGWLSGDAGLPDSASGVAEALLAVSFLQGPEGLEPFLDAQHRRLHLSVFLRHADYRRTQRVVETLRGFARDRWAGRVRIEIGGDARVSQAAVDSVVTDQMRGLFGALAGVLVLLVVLLRSLRAALVVTVPVAMAVLLNLVIMGLVDLPLGIATSMFSTVSVGIGVDYALHLWWRTSGAGAESAAGAATVTRAVTVNALVVSAGFLSLLVSRTPPVRDLGALVGVAMGASLLFAITLLPALGPASRSSSGEAGADADG